MSTPASTVVPVHLAESDWSLVIDALYRQAEALLDELGDRPDLDAELRPRLEAFRDLGHEVNHQILTTDTPEEFHP